MSNQPDKVIIAYCIPSLYYPSGMERVLTLKANYLVEYYGYEVHIILTDGGDRLPYYSLHPQVQLHQLNVNYDHLYSKPLWKKLFYYFYKQSVFKQRLSVCLKKIRPHITVSLLRRDINFINSITDGSLKVGEIHFNKNNYRDFSSTAMPVCMQVALKKLWMAQLIKQLKKLAVFVVLTHEDAEAWTELDTVTVIHNPLSFYPNTVSNLQKKEVIAVGRYMPQKGFDRLINVWKIVLEKHPDWVLRIYGDGMRNELQEKIDSLHIASNCILEPSVPNIIEKYCASSIFVLTSRFEGFGLVITEAMACGLPTVAFDCPCGPKDIIKDGIDGFLVRDGDIEAFARKISCLIEDQDLRKNMGAKARIHVQRFLLPAIMPQWDTLFKELAKKYNNLKSQI